jgi:hypothetical protein
MSQANNVFFRLARTAPIFFIVAFGAATISSAANMRFDNGGGDGLWETAANWNEDANPDTIPGASDMGDISNSFTASISSTRTINELNVGWPNGTTGTQPGVATLNVLPGAALTVAGGSPAPLTTAGFRVGRALKVGQSLGSSKGVILQTGGSVTLTGTTQGLRLSAGESGNVADSYYGISGGSFLANSPAGNAIQVGNLASNYTLAEFHVIGSGATSIRTDDFRMQDSPTGTTRLHMSLDDNGVTQITADDEFQFRGSNNNELLVDLIGLPPLADITLVRADRLGNNSQVGTPIEMFSNYQSDGAAVTASIGPLRQRYTYNWTIDYQDDNDDADQDAYIILRFQSRTLSVPEPTSLGLVALGGMTLLLRRRRSN